METPLVSVCMIAYNHEPFIAQAIEGVVMQQTSFPVELVIGEDCSTDYTREVILKYKEQYSDKIRLLFRNKNIGIQQNLIDTLQKCAGKYIALCEGDDYWTDPYKLQKQVDFLETHLDYSLCCHRYRIYNQNTDTWEDDYVAEKFKEFPDGFSFSNKENFECWITKTMTLMFRASEQLWKSLQQYSYTRDVHLNYHLLKQGKGYCLPWGGAVYRRHDGGVFALKDVNEKQYVQYCVFKDIWCKNQDDGVLNIYWRIVLKSYLDSLRSMVFVHHIECEDIKKIYLFLKDEYIYYGLKSMLCDIKKLFFSYMKGFSYGKQSF